MFTLCFLLKSQLLILRKIKTSILIFNKNWNKEEITKLQESVHVKFGKNIYMCIYIYIYLYFFFFLREKVVSLFGSTFLWFQS